jgi:hypothetical protein
MPLVSNLLNNRRFPPHVAWSVALIGAVSLTIGIAHAAGVFDGTDNGTYGLSGQWNHPSCMDGNGGKITIALEDNHLHPTLLFTPYLSRAAPEWHIRWQRRAAF